MMEESFNLSIVIVSWNEKELIYRCLSSFYSEYKFDDDEIIVIDNGSR